jgi:hypothetical protein
MPLSLNYSKLLVQTYLTAFKNIYISEKFPSYLQTGLLVHAVTIVSDFVFFYAIHIPAKIKKKRGN